MAIFKIPSEHESCGTALEEKTVPVDEKVLTLNPYPVNYCPNCDVYIFGEKESPYKEIIGHQITKDQEESNLKTNGSIYSAQHLKLLSRKA